ncbi:major facilitator superfamily domain-containing protein [Dactylonectria estremocensis]|uniref:Major facilitator superfamily domain-containing protein n=1 Tax=Dactylonectria estremocensis TaxID=1079267 RepID=A0A9P9F784_9HYPO|nr:major facilitator superfamily domain-containing protein [Dactylonectria estremocensis]
MAYTSVFPYLPDMIKSFGIPQNDVAKWAGITSGVFSISQSITAVGWGKASDTYGRKPSIITGLLTTMVCFVVWGMSTSLPMAIAVRAIQGGSNGNVGIIRTMVAEMVTEKELQPRAFSIMPLVWSVGSVIGPIFGGFFAEPAKQYPALFGNIEYFKRFPFVLPNLVLTIFFLLSVTCAMLFLHETLPSKKGKHDWGLLVGQRLTRALKRKPAAVSSRRLSFVDGEATAPLLPNKVVLKKHTQEPVPHGLMDVFTYQTVINLLAYSFLAFHSVAYDQIITVFLNYPVVEKTPENFKPPFYFSGGFGLSSGEIGTMFTLYGIVCAFIQFIVYPPLVTRYGVLRCFRVCSLITPIAYFLTPYCVLFETSQARLAALLCVMFVKGAAIIVGFPSTTILLTNSCSSLSVLGTLNGFATTFSGIGRAIGPASAGAVFTWGAGHGYAVASWFYLTAFAIAGAIPVFLIVEGDGPTASAESSDAEDSDSSASGTLLLDGSVVLDDSETEDEGLPSQGYGTMKSGRV